jgi:Xaa-Pro aminopeptidase
MAARGIDGILLTSKQNARYFTGLKTLLYLTKLRPITALLPADAKFEPIMIVPEVLEATCLATTWVENIRTNSECYGKPTVGMLETIQETITDLGLSSGVIGMEFGTGHYLAMTHEDRKQLEASLPRAQFVDVADLIWDVRSRKSALEVEALKTACDISATGITEGLKAFRLGMTERQLYAIIASTYYREGAEDHMLIFHSGAKGNQVRDAAASDYPFERGHFMKVDGGACYKGYWCDFCRMLSVGPLSDSRRRAMLASARANASAISIMKQGKPIRDLAIAADNVLKDEGFGRYMNAIGHNVGLDIHEPPWLDRVSTQPLHEGMVLSVEVGVVDPNLFDDGSYTFEDNAVVTVDGSRLLTDQLPAVPMEIM